MKKTLYLECYSGISGDMTVAALIDLGADQKRLKNELASLKVDGYTIDISRVTKSGLDVCDFAVKTEDGHSGLDHDMEYLHGKSRGHVHHREHDHNYDEIHEHDHHHDETHEHLYEYDHHYDDTVPDESSGRDEHIHGHHHDHHHVHRGLPEITAIIEGSQMSENAKATALKIFDILAEAESEAHGVPKDKVHFHEVGAVDSIVDIAAAAICLDDLDIAEVIVPVLCEGRGTIRCQHGIIPIPAPATLNIIADHHLNLQLTDVMGEFVTPTGAAIVAATITSDRLPKSFKIEGIGLGAGKREYERPGILRAMIIDPEDEN